jgi:hypothetical protein
MTKSKLNAETRRLLESMLSHDLHVIETDGAVTSVSFSTPPTFDDIRQWVSCETLEHVSVLFKGREAHMYVDEDGLSKDLPLNHRASRIYANVLLSRIGRPTYDDLTIEPSRGVVISQDRPLIIVGRAVLWCGARI